MKHPSPDTVGIIFRAQRWVYKDIMGSLYCLELGVEFLLFSGIPIRMKLECYNPQALGISMYDVLGERCSSSYQASCIVS